mgnify:CR=1 FL=1
MDRMRFVKSRNIFRRIWKRGVSYHHAGLGNKERSCVEMLFREKCLQVTFHQWKYLNRLVRLTFVLN